MAKVYTTLCAVLFVLCCTNTWIVSCLDRQLRFKKDGTFKIMQFTDLHYGEGDGTGDIQSGAQQRDLLRFEKDVDLVVLSGDTVSGYSWPNFNTGSCMNPIHTPDGGVEMCYRQMVIPMIEQNVRWAFTFGNHDDQGNLSREKILKIDMSYQNSLTQGSDPTLMHGLTNYVLTIQASNSTDAVSHLYMMDSSDNNCLGVTGWGCVYPDQVEWYRQTSRALQSQYNGTRPSLAFMHIPVPEYMSLWSGFPTNGNKSEDICCFSVNTGLFAAMKEMGDVVQVNSGHDHNNDFIGSYNGITLAYGRKTGFGGYGPPPGWERGARVIELTENPFSINTYIRTESGAKIVQGPSIKTARQDVCCGAAGGAPGSCHEYVDNYRFKNGLPPINH